MTNGQGAGKLRFSEVSKIDDPKMYNFVAKQGEEIEKLVRNKLTSSIEPRKLRSMNFSVKIKTLDSESGVTSIQTSRSNTLFEAPGEDKQIQDAFNQVVKGLKLNYRTEN